VTWGGYIFFLLFYGVLAFCIHGHWKRTREPGLSDRQRKMYRLTFVAMLFGLLASSDFLGYMGVPWPPFSFVFLAVWMTLYAVAILKYKLFRLTTEIAAPAIIESMPSALFVVNMDGEIVIVNPHASKLTRVASEEMRGRDVTEFIPKAAGFLTEAAEHPPLGPLRSESEATLKDGGGGDRPVVLSAMPIHGGRGVPIGVTIIATDIAKLREQVITIETQKAELQKTVAQMGKIQDQLVGRELRMIELKKEIEKLKG
jgi:PAS domain S-box-containing protein